MALSGSEIASLREDISEALNAKEIKKNQLVGVQTELHEADQELRALETDLEAPDFMNDLRWLCASTAMPWSRSVAT